MHETSARGWCTGMTQSDGMGREWEGGSGWGTHVNPWLIYVSVWQKPLQYCKVISLQLIKIIGKKKYNNNKKNPRCNAVDVGSIPAWGGKIPPASWQLSLHTAPIEPVGPQPESVRCNKRSHVRRLSPDTAR